MICDDDDCDGVDDYDDPLHHVCGVYDDCVRDYDFLSFLNFLPHSLHDRFVLSFRFRALLLPHVQALWSVSFVDSIVSSLLYNIHLIIYNLKID